MHTLFSKLSCFAGLLVFLLEVGSRAPLERLLITSFGTGLAIYLVLIIGYLSVHHIMAHAPPPETEEDREEASQTSNPDSDPVRSSASHQSPQPQAA